MPKRNYQFEKRQKDLAKKQKREEKQQRKLERAKGASETESTDVAASEADADLQSPGPLT